MKLKNKKNNKGVSLIIAILVLSLILATVTAISGIFTGEIKNSRVFEQSTHAYYAADSGGEAILYNQLKSASPLTDTGGTAQPCAIVGLTFTIPTDLSCQIDVIISGGTTTLQSTGFYRLNQAQRKVEIFYGN